MFKLWNIRTKTPDWVSAPSLAGLASLGTIKKLFSRAAAAEFRDGEVTLP